MTKKEIKKQTQIKHIILTAILMFIGLLIFKYLPEYIYGNEILFDASQHLIITIFILYIIYFFIDQNKKFKIPYYIFSAAIVTIVALQRIYAHEHNEFGILLALIISALSIYISHWKYFRRRVEF